MCQQNTFRTQQPVKKTDEVKTTEKNKTSENKRWCNKTRKTKEKLLEKNLVNKQEKLGEKNLVKKKERKKLFPKEREDEKPTEKRRREKH